MTRLDQSMYHSILRISAAVVAIVLLLVSGLVSQTTALLTNEAGRSLATAVSMTLGVAPTELNQITTALTERERQLSARETAVTERELSLGLTAGSRTARIDRSTFILSAILFILLVMIVFNYVLDFSRQRTNPSDRRWEATS